MLKLKISARAVNSDTDLCDLMYMGKQAQQLYHSLKLDPISVNPMQSRTFVKAELEEIFTDVLELKQFISNILEYFPDMDKYEIYIERLEQ